MGGTLNCLGRRWSGTAFWKAGCWHSPEGYMSAKGKELSEAFQTEVAAYAKGWI